MPQGFGQGDSLPAVIGPDSVLISWLAWLSHIWLQATTSIFLRVASRCCHFNPQSSSDPSLVSLKHVCWGAALTKTPLARAEIQ